MSNTLTRRSFLHGAAAALALTATGVRPLYASAPGKVIILGAGLGGLAAAYELNKAGYEVTVLEARTRPGGRVTTYRDPFADGLYAEMGAEYVDAADEYDHRYCKEFGLKVMTAKMYDAIFVRGKIFKMASFKANKEQLPFEHTEPGVLFGQEAEYTKKIRALVTDREHLPAELLKLDNLSVAQYLTEQGASQDVISLYTYLNATEQTARPEEMSALNMIKGHLQQTDFSEVQNEGRIFGGNDQLPKSFAQALSDKIFYSRPVRKIAHNREGAQVWFDENGSLQSVSARWLVIALPFTILRELEITPEFPADKMRCIRTLAYGHVMKIAMQHRTRFWDEAESPGQRVFTDTKLRRIYHMSIDQPGPRGILMSFTSAKDAEDLGKLPEDERIRTALQEVTKIWPQAPRFFERGVTKYWNEDPWLKGSYSFTGVGQEQDFLELAKRPEGAVFFAGEHTSPFRASMNGAIESGVRAAAEVQKTASTR